MDPVPFPPEGRSFARGLHFQPAGPRAERERAVQEWRDGWAEHRHTFKRRWNGG